MNHSPDVILDLVGTLDDSPGDETARERFRNYLAREVEDVGHTRDLIEECLRGSGTQYARALQDLVNYVGPIPGLEVKHRSFYWTAEETGLRRGTPGDKNPLSTWSS